MGGRGPKGQVWFYPFANGAVNITIGNLTLLNAKLGIFDSRLLMKIVFFLGWRFVWCYIYSYQIHRERCQQNDIKPDQCSKISTQT